MDIKLMVLSVFGLLACYIGFSEAICDVTAAQDLQGCSSTFISDISGLNVNDQSACSAAVSAVDRFTSCLSNVRNNNPGCSSEIKTIEDAIQAQRQTIGDTCGSAAITVSIFGLLAMMLVNYVLK